MECPSTINPEQELSFGVELEGILAFHEDSIHEIVQSHRPGSTINKDTQDIPNEHLRHERYPQLPYQSWAISDASGNPNPYLDEPLHLMKKVVDASPSAPMISIHNDKQTTFSSWILSAEPNVPGVPPESLSATFTQRIGSAAESSKWDSWGVEIISPPYAAKQTSSLESDLHELLQPIHTSPTASLATTSKCGFHVHIGLPNGSAWPLSVVQHLAYLVLVYEHELLTLVDPCRRATPPSAMLTPDQQEHLAHELISNRENIAEPDPHHFTHDGRRVRFTHWDLSRVRAAIFDAEDTPRSTALEKVCKLLGWNRGHVIAFRPLCAPETDGRARTVEFRMQRSTLDPKEVGRWVEFCVGFVRLAWRFAAEDERRGGEQVWGTRCRVGSWMERIAVEDLLGEMGLSGESQEYWLAIREEYERVDPAWKATPLWEVDEEELEDEEWLFGED
jgi:hypothetical protein